MGFFLVLNFLVVEDWSSEKHCTLKFIKSVWLHKCLITFHSTEHNWLPIPFYFPKFYFSNSKVPFVTYLSYYLVVICYFDTEIGKHILYSIIFIYIFPAPIPSLIWCSFTFFLLLGSINFPGINMLIIWDIDFRHYSSPVLFAWVFFWNMIGEYLISSGIYLKDKFLSHISQKQNNIGNIK